MTSLYSCAHAHFFFFFFFLLQVAFLSHVIDMNDEVREGEGKGLEKKKKLCRRDASTATILPSLLSTFVMSFFLFTFFIFVYEKAHLL